MRGYVALTYDDGPNPGTSLPLLKALRDNGATATFFIWGAHAAQHPDLLRAVRSDGHEIANHTQTHPHLTQIGDPAAFHEIDQAQQTIGRITGRAPTLFRPPFGETSKQIRGHAARLGMSEVLWSVDTRDYAGVSTDQIVAAAATVPPGGIILMHDNGYQTTIAAVPRILKVLAARGLAPGRIVAPHPLEAPEVRPPTR